MAPGQTVTVFIRRATDARKQHIITMQRDRLTAHSWAFRLFLEHHKVANEDEREITLPIGSPAAMKHVIDIINAYRGRQELYINLRTMTIKQAIAIWAAAQEIQIDPVSARNKIMGVLTWRVSHETLTPDIMIAVYEVFMPLRNHPDPNVKKLWDVLVHQYVWDMLHGNYSERQQRALEAVYTQRPPLAIAIAAKEDELRPKKALHDEWNAKNEIRDNNKKVRKHYQQQRKAEEERIKQQVEEVVSGMRPMTEELRPHVLARQRRTASGEGKKDKQQ